jgi:acyl-coenzyme A thioesterase 13
MSSSTKRTIGETFCVLFGIPLDKANLTEGFDSVSNNVYVEEFNDQFAIAKCTASKQNCNMTGYVHGGFYATAVDTITSLPLVKKDPTKPGVSIDLTVNYIGSAKLGDELKIVGTVVKVTKSLAFTKAEIYNAKTGQLLINAMHTKAFPMEYAKPKAKL